MTVSIDLYFSCGSTYTYLTVMRLRQAEAEHGVHFQLHPFYLGILFQEMNRRPFLEEPQKTAYMWRDIARRAAWRGLTPTLPAPYPAVKAVQGNQIAWLALREPWGRDYLEASYRAWFERGRLPGEPDNIAESFAAVGQNPDTVLTGAALKTAHEAVVQQTDAARKLGIFGSPTFVVGQELFWGDDRLEDAVRWAKTQQ